jgi:hypothetical protein
MVQYRNEGVEGSVAAQPEPGPVPAAGEQLAPSVEGGAVLVEHNVVFLKQTEAAGL